MIRPSDIFIVKLPTRLETDVVPVALVQVRTITVLGGSQYITAPTLRIVVFSTRRNDLRRCRVIGIHRGCIDTVLQFQRNSYDFEVAFGRSH